MVRKPNWRNRNAGVSLMESAHRIGRVSIDLNRPVIDLAYCLNLKVISPNSVCSLGFNVRREIGLTSNNEFFEEVLLHHDVVHAPLSHQIVEAFVSVHLVSHSSEQAVPISFCWDNF